MPNSMEAQNLLAPSQTLPLPTTIRVSQSIHSLHPIYCHAPYRRRRRRRRPSQKSEKTRLAASSSLRRGSQRNLFARLLQRIARQYAFQQNPIEKPHFSNFRTLVEYEYYYFVCKANKKCLTANKRVQ